MGWSESYYADMAGEAGRKFAERVLDLMEAFRRTRRDASTYEPFHPLFGELSRMVETWEAELRASCQDVATDGGAAPERWTDVPTGGGPAGEGKGAGGRDPVNRPASDA